MKNALVLCLIMLFAASAAAHSPREIQCRFNSDCMEPLVCAASLCRLQCRTDRDCVNGWVCRGLRLIDVPPESTSVPAVEETHNRCVAPGSDNLARVVPTPRGLSIEFLPVLAPVAAVPSASSQNASPGYAVPQQPQRSGTTVIQAPVIAINPAVNARRVHRAGGLEFRRGERDDFLHLRREGGEWTTAGAGEITSEPAAIAAPDGEVYVFAKGKDDAIWGVRCSGGGTCGDWFSLGGVLTSAPAVTIDAAGKIRITATGTDGRPWSVTGDGAAWSGWTPQ